MNYPYHGARYNWGATSFLENYGGTNTGDFCQMVTRKGWKCYSDGSWDAFTSGSFDVGTIGGTSSNYFYMTTKDGFQSNVNAQNRVQTVSAPTITKPAIPVINALSSTVSYNAATAMLTVTWTIDPNSCPQIAYTINIYSTTSNINILLIISTDMQSNIRSVSIGLGNFNTGSYTAKLTLQDVLDNTSPLYTNTFVITSTVKPIQSPTSSPSKPTLSPKTILCSPHLILSVNKVTSSLVALPSYITILCQAFYQLT
jgi:hypothetical protein